MLHTWMFHSYKSYCEIIVFEFYFVACTSYDWMAYTIVSLTCSIVLTMYWEKRKELSVRCNSVQSIILRGFKSSKNIIEGVHVRTLSATWLRPCLALMKFIAELIVYFDSIHWCESILFLDVVRVLLWFDMLVLYTLKYCPGLDLKSFNLLSTIG